MSCRWGRKSAKLKLDEGSLGGVRNAAEISFVKFRIAYVKFRRRSHSSSFVEPTSARRCSTKSDGDAGAAISRGPAMQLYGEGKLQGITVNAIPKSERPAALDGTLVGDVGFDPLGFSSLIDLRWLREAELKHGRVCMLAATGLIVQDVYQFPGITQTFGNLKVTALHDAAVKQGSMQQVMHRPPPRATTPLHVMLAVGGQGVLGFSCPFGASCW